MTQHKEIEEKSCVLFENQIRMTVYHFPKLCEQIDESMTHSLFRNNFKKGVSTRYAPLNTSN